MLKKISLSNFKSHRKSEIVLENITLLTGLNGVGKSSVFQALLLLRQSNRKRMLETGLELKGDLCDIGSARDALYQSATSDLISFELIDELTGQHTFQFEFDENKQNDTFLKRSPDHRNSLDLNFFSNNFQYISAFRNGPAKDYDRDTYQVEISKQISLKEGRCELAAHYLDYYGKTSVSDNSLIFPSDEQETDLHSNVQQWMNAISPGIQIFVESLQSSFRLNYKFSRGAGKTPTEYFKATNIGFGISYVLPIVIAALHAPKGSVILIENPEAHIHPAGQAKLMELICRSAKTGVQFIIETHSDHVVNGVLVATKEEIVTASMVSIYFFDRKEETHETIPYQLPVLKGGKINKPPKGFFDQIDVDMKTLMGF